MRISEILKQIEIDSDKTLTQVSLITGISIYNIRKQLDNDNMTLSTLKKFASAFNFEIVIKIEEQQLKIK